jgi:hypothetical protein
LLAVAAGAVTLTLLFPNQRQPLSQWLFWRFAVIYGCVLFFGAAYVPPRLARLRIPFHPKSCLAPVLSAGQADDAVGAGNLVGIAIWFWTYHQDRYLQTLLPWMVAVTTSEIWFTGSSARASGRPSGGPR